MRAQTLAQKTFGVSTVAAATAILKDTTKLPANLKFSKVFFVGHGNPGLFFFGGHPVTTKDSDGKDVQNFACNDNQVLQDPSADADSAAFMTELAKHLATAGFQISFVGCEVGQGLAGKVGGALNGKGFSNGFVGGYTHPYNLVYNPNTKQFQDQLLADDSDNAAVIDQEADNAIPRYDVNVPVTQ
jgi:hypothetical protein